MQDEKDSFTIFEDQDDYVENIKDQFREAIRRYTIYCKMFGHPKNWKMMRDEIKRFLHYELQKTFHHTVIKETSDGIIIMKFFAEKDEND